MPCDSSIPIVPVSGFLDRRSTVDLVPFGGYRRADNVDVTTKQRLCRARGWTKHRDADPYNNQDLHNQLVVPGLEQSPTLLYQARTGAGFTKLFAATQNRIYSEVPATGNWRLLSDEFGGEPEDCSEILWSAGHVGQIVVFSNNVDPPVSSFVDQGPNEPNNQSVSPIRDLERLNVTRVGLVIAWNNVMFYMDVEQDGVRVRNRVLWSDYKRPLSIVPNKGISLAGTSDLLSGEIILAAAPMADALMIYTSMRIWEVRVSGDDNVFSFNKRYTHEEGSRCLAYKRTLVTTGSSHYYMGRDGIYRYSFYVTEPELVEYIHRASAVIFDDINTAACNAHCAEFFPDRRQVWFSWARAGEACPGNTLVVGTEFPFCSVIDEGFTAFVNTEPHNNLILRDWIRDLCICTTAELVENGFGFINEGGYCTPQSDPECPTRPHSFYTQTPRYEADIDVTTEEWTQATPDADSFASLFQTLTVDQLCNTEFLAGECNASATFVMASSVDKCLKDAAEVFYREHCTSTVGCGTYSKDGYKSLLTSGALHFNAPDREKIASCFQVEAHPEPATVPGQMIFRIGVATQAIDPITASGRCMIAWEEQDPFVLECQSDLTLAQSRAEGTFPDQPFAWPLFAKGFYLYYEIEIGNPRSTPRDTGAAVCISRYDLTARQLSKC